VTYLAFALDPQTRTLDARIEVPNKDSRLRPGMFATAAIKAPVAASTMPTTMPAPSKPAGEAVMARVFQDALLPYLQSTDLLAHDKMEDVPVLLAKTVDSLKPIAGDEKLKDAYARLTSAVKETPGEKLDNLRDTFKKVSLALIDVAKVTGQPIDAPAVQIYLCPMKDKPYWLQVTGPVANPYMGLRMFDCGGPVETLPKAAPVHSHEMGSSAEQAYSLAIPRSAVIDTGTRKIVFVQSSPGIFDMKQVVLGALSADDLYPVLSGIKEGDQVVTSGAFLLDSENRLNPASSTTGNNP
jgi:hypothetical protein